jgi:DNA-binding PadR family transcriptional regulator
MEYAFNRRMIQDFMDIIILKHLRASSMSGYDIIKYFHKRFHMLPSPGTVYSILRSLERQNLIEGNADERKKLYRLTNQGEKFLSQIFAPENHFQAILASIFSEVQS